MIICMIMRKKQNTSKKPHASLARATRTLYACGMLLIAAPLFYLTLTVTAKEALTVPECKLYAAMLEHILAGLTILTGGCYLVERVCREKEK